ncbi:MAG: DUF4173 domain-containing protein [Clostridia bacterium]|nr:DUF4173 domain-containing protein [Clostridia bacterium]
MDNIPNNNTQPPVIPPYGNGTPAGVYVNPMVPVSPSVAKLNRFKKIIDEFIKQKKAGVCVLLLFALFFGGFLLLNYGIYGGVLIPVGFVILYAAFLILIPKNRLHFDAVSILLLISCVFLYSTYAFNSNTLTNLVTAPVAVVLTALLFMQQSDLSIDAFTLATPVEASRVYLSQAFAILPAPVKSVGFMLRNKEGKSKIILNALIGVACTVPFVIILTALFTSADALFKNTVDNFFKNFGLSDVFRIIGAVIASSLVTLFVAPMLFSVVTSEEDTITEKEKPSRLNSVAVCAFLVILTLLEGLFGFVQVRGLFAGRLPENINYAEYARSGFFHIAGATALTVAIIAGVYFICGKIKIPVKIMLTVFSATATILFASAYFRMYMYMTALGLTVKRVAICWLITLLLALLIGIVIKIWLPKKFPLFGYTVIAVTLFTIVLGGMRLDTLVSKYNVDLFLNAAPEKEVTVDVNYLKQLSPEALPQIVRLEGTRYNTLATRAEAVMKYKLENFYGRQCGINFNLGLSEAEKILDERRIGFSTEETEHWVWGNLNYKDWNEEWDAEDSQQEETRY